MAFKEYDFEFTETAESDINLLTLQQYEINRKSS